MPFYRVEIMVKSPYTDDEDHLERLLEELINESSIGARVEHGPVVFETWHGQDCGVPPWLRSSR